MSIPTSAIKLYASQEMDDTDQGGGIKSGTEIPDNVPNNVFPNLSPLDRVYGKIKLRKVFPKIGTLDTQTFSGGHFIVARGPVDPRVSITIFTTGDWNDQRSAARNYVESYVIGGPVSDWRLYEDQLPGQRTILVFGDVSATPPNVGDVLLLSTEATGFAANQQYVRVSSIDVSVRNFRTGECGSFSAQVITIGLSDALRYRFYGESPTCMSDEKPATLVRTTIPADTARYYSITTLADAASIGDLSLKVASIYAQIVPSVTVEAPVANAQAGSLAQVVVAAGTTPIAFSFVNEHGLPQPQYMARAMVPGSVTVNGVTDDSTGFFRDNSGNASGSLSYALGTINGTPNLAIEGMTGQFIPAAVLNPVANTNDVPITLANRGFNYVLACSPIPSPGTMVVSFRAQGRWYDLKDQGDGTLVGANSGYGTGTINFETGDVIVTTGALPDVGTSLLSSWGTPAHYRIRTGDITFHPPQVVGTLAHTGVTPGSVTFSWEVGGVAKTATDDSHGALTGDATGTIDYVTGNYALQQANIQDAGSGIQADYQATGSLNYQATPSADDSGAVTFTLPGFPIKPGSLSFSAFFNYQTWSQSGRLKLVIVDDGVGGLKRADNGTVVSGSIDYATGVVIATLQNSAAAPAYALPSGQVVGGGGVVGNATWSSGGWTLTYTLNMTYDHASGVNATYLPAAAGVASAYTDTLATPALTVDLSPHTVETIVPGSIDFVFAGHRYVDRQGSIYRDIDNNNNSGTLAGTMDYTSGVATLTNYVSGANTLMVRSLLTQNGNPTVWQIRFRAPGAPIRPSSMFVRAVRARDGVQITATTDANGNIISTDAVGAVDQDNGIARVDFGRKVLDSSLTDADKAEWWYNADNVDGTGHIFRPWEILPDTIKFNCVVFTSVPVDADLLGLDPVRLPQDGRVPMMRDGDVLVVMNTQSQTLPNPVELDHVYATRADIAVVQVRDAQGVLVDDTLYSIDPDSGDFKFNADADLSGYTQPFDLANRVEDMVRAGAVQIDGSIQLAGALSHDYAEGETLVASALLIGDMQGRAYNLFTQATWLGVWADSPSGAGTVGQYDVGNHPIEVTNKGSIKERWRLNFTSTTAFQVIGETRGQVATGDINDDCAPVNPAEGVPFFTLRAAGFSSGWQPGNVVRFNTDGSDYPIWMAETTVSGPKTAANDSTQTELRGAS